MGNQINKPNTHFNPVLYAGNDTSQSITGVGFQPDWTWIKCRSNNENHALYDSVRGATKHLISNLTNAEVTRANGLTAFNSDGFSVGSENDVNDGSQTFASWNWKAGGTASSNTDGDITSSVSANTTAGFSIVSYTGNGTGSATFGHGLSATPKIVIIKRRDVGDGWQFWFNNTIRLGLNVTNGDYGNNPISTSSTLVTTPSGVDTAWNTNGASYISYCFAEKKGFSKFGSYTGNGNATDSPFIYTGFKPAFVLIKASNATESWTITDDARDTYNPATKILFPNLDNTEGSNTGTDYLSNGFKLRTGDGAMNLNSSTNYIYMAFAENPLVGTNGVPATAR